MALILEAVELVVLIALIFPGALIGYMLRGECDLINKKVPKKSRV